MTYLSDDGTIEIEDFEVFKREFPSIEEQTRKIMELAFPGSHTEYEFAEVCQSFRDDDIQVQYIHKENNCIDIRFQYTVDWDLWSMEWEED